MANMREIKLRIKSIEETRQITRAMKLISASKLKKARRQLDQTRPYFTKVKSTIADILLHSENIESKYFEKPQNINENTDDRDYFDKRPEKDNKKVGIIILTGDKGLAGGYNHNIIKLAEELICGCSKSQLFIAGVIGRNYFVRNHYNVEEKFDYPVQNPTVYRAREMADDIVVQFLTHELDEIYLIYTELVSAIKMVTKNIKLLPLDLDELKEELGLHGNAQLEKDDAIIYEPSPKAVWDVLIPKYLKGIIYGALVEAFTSEQSARMAAMDNATANADDMLHQLKLNYNRARQSAITQEISEIVGGTATTQ